MAMGRFLLSGYYLIFYSVGVASLVYALILRASGKEPLLGRFIACTAAMTAVLLPLAILDASGNALRPALQDALRWMTRVFLPLYSYLLIAFAVEVFPVRKARAIKATAAILSCAALALCVAGALAGAGRWIGAAILGLKDASIVFVVVLALATRRGLPAAEGSAASYRSFFRVASALVAFIVPFMIWEEAADLLGSSAFPVKGSLSLPACYGIWSTSFIASRLKRSAESAGAARPPAERSSPGAAFISRYGITAREGELLGLLVRGLSYKRIMAELSISMPTVKSHVSSLYRKTGTANRLELADLVQKDEPPGA
jgi:DNA-binding CsgD family transcriptional regulator